MCLIIFRFLYDIVPLIDLHHEQSDHLIHVHSMYSIYPLRLSCSIFHNCFNEAKSVLGIIPFSCFALYKAHVLNTYNDFSLSCFRPMLLALYFQRSHLFYLHPNIMMNPTTFFRTITFHPRSTPIVTYIFYKIVMVHHKHLLRMDVKQHLHQHV